MDKLKRKLNSIGKTVFIEQLYPELKKNPNISKSEFLLKHPDFKESKNSENTCFSNARSIFQEGLICEALEIIIESKVPETIKLKAKHYLLLERGLGGISQELDEKEELDTEGLRKQVYVNRYERNAEARSKAIEYHCKNGIKCCICGFDFEKVYGELGKGFIHIHHITPISEIGKSYEVNYKTDLIPVCPNCHAMLHRGQDGRLLTIEELKDILNQNKEL